MARPGRAFRAMAGALDEDSQTDTGEHLVAMWLHGRLSQLEWSDPAA